MSAFQPYFVAYARAHGVTPEAMAARPTALCNADFMAWIHEQWATFRTLRPDCFGMATRLGGGHVTEAGRAAFGEWLATINSPQTDSALIVGGVA